LSAFPPSPLIDDSTLRNKLKEYELLGLIKSEKCGRKLAYFRDDAIVDLQSWREAAAFFSEICPVGVIGDYLLDKYGQAPDYFSFKHHYILHALESEVLLALLSAINGQSNVQAAMFSRRRQAESVQMFLPLHIYISCQTGRRYVMCYHWRSRRIQLFRLDSIRDVKLLEPQADYQKYRSFAAKFKENLWGVSSGADFSLDHLEMTVYVGAGEGHIVQRLQREKRCGALEALDEHTYRYSADIYDAAELLPWLRTFTGRIISLHCSDSYVVETFYADFAEMQRMYGGETDAV